MVNEVTFDLIKENKIFIQKSMAVHIILRYLCQLILFQNAGSFFFCMKIKFLCLYE